MNKLILCLSLFAVACSATMSLRTAPAVEYIENRDDLGQYAFRYYTAEGTLVEQRGYLIDIDGARVLIIEGTVTYKAPDGKIYITKYTSGIDGYHAYGDHIPKEEKESKTE